MKHVKALAVLSCISGVALSSCALMGNPFGSGGNNPFRPSSSSGGQGNSSYSGGQGNSSSYSGGAGNSSKAGSIPAGKRIKIGVPYNTDRAVLEDVLANRFGNEGLSFDLETVDAYSDPNVVPDCDIFPANSYDLQTFYRRGYLSPLPNGQQSISASYEVFQDGAKIPGTENPWTGEYTLGGYPFSNATTYFLFYNKSVYPDLADVASIENILDRAKETGTKFAMELGSAWYNMSFMFACGAESKWETDGDGRFTGFSDTVLEDGFQGAYAMHKILHHPSFVNSSSPSFTSEKVSAVVVGTWLQQDLLNLWGDDLAYVPLPHFDYLGAGERWLKPFANCTYLCVKPHEDAWLIEICHKAAEYLSSEEVQLRLCSDSIFYTANRDAAKGAYQDDPMRLALHDQLDNSYFQGSIPNGWWDAGSVIFQSLSRLPENATDEDIMEVLRNYEDALHTFLE